MTSKFQMLFIIQKSKKRKGEDDYETETNWY